MSPEPSPTPVEATKEGRADNGIPEEAPVIETYFEDVPYLLSLIDSLTAERDRYLAALEAITDLDIVDLYQQGKGSDLYAEAESIALAALATPPSEGGES